MAVVLVTSKEDFKSKLQTDKLVVVDFFADWCGPCKMIAPKLADMAKEFEGKAIVLKVNVDDCEDVAAEAGVSAMPTFQAFKDGNKIDEVVGASEAKLRELFTKHS